MAGGILAKAQAFAGLLERPGLLHTALKASINCESARPLARGSESLARFTALGRATPCRVGLTRVYVGPRIGHGRPIRAGVWHAGGR